MQSRHHPITVGLCAMDKKVKAKPMRELTKRMEVGGEFVFIEYGDDMILNQPISEWPVPDVLIALFLGRLSAGEMHRVRASPLSHGPGGNPHGKVTTTTARVLS